MTCIRLNHPVPSPRFCRLHHHPVSILSIQVTHTTAFRLRVKSAASPLLRRLGDLICLASLTSGNIVATRDEDYSLCIQRCSPPLALPPPLLAASSLPPRSPSTSGCRSTRTIEDSSCSQTRKSCELKMRQRVDLNWGYPDEIHSSHLTSSRSFAERLHDVFEKVRLRSVQVHEMADWLDCLQASNMA